MKSHIVYNFINNLILSSQKIDNYKIIREFNKKQLFSFLRISLDFLQFMKRKFKIGVQILIVIMLFVKNKK